MTPSTVFPSDLVLAPVSRWPLRLPGETVDTVMSRPLPASSHSAGTAPLASIVVVTFNNLVFTRLCLESLLDTGVDSVAEIIVVDNGSEDETPDYLKQLAERFSRIRLLLNPDNRGFAAANNQALALARGDSLVLLNNDTVLAPGHLERLLAHLENPDIGLVGPVSNRCGNEAQIEVDYETYGAFLDFAARRATEHAGELTDIPMPAMFCLAMRRKTWQRLGPLDERYEVGLFEDEDYALRAARAGLRRVCAEDVFVHHFGQATIGWLAASGDYGDLFHRNRRRFEKKWQCNWRPHSRRQNRTYQALISRIRDVVIQTVPASATVLVVSRGDDNLLLLGGRRSRHFPQSASGGYAGYHPADGDTAVAQLEQLTSAGGAYLVLPETSFWWLEFYPELTRHLAERCECTLRDDACLIYRLRREADSGLKDGLKDSDHVDSDWEFVGQAPEDPQVVTILVMADHSAEQLGRCLDFLNQSGSVCRILVMADGSCGAAIWPLIESLANQQHALCGLRHHRPVGWAAMLNECCERAPGDVVVLSSRVRVTSGWLEKLSACAADENCAGASPLMVLDAAVAAGGEKIFNLEAADPEQASRAAAHLSQRLRPGVPVANRWCLYLRRQALHQIGLFDQARFPGAEALADFGRRASRAGMPVLLDDATVIGALTVTDKPAGGRSTHTGCQEQVAQWLAKDPLVALRRRLSAPEDPGGDDSQRRDSTTGLLLVVHDGSGGAVYAAEDLAAGLDHTHRPLLLKTGPRCWTLHERWGERLKASRCYRFSNPWNVDLGLDQERITVLAEICNDFQVSLVHLHHLLGNGPPLVAELNAKNIPVVFTVHDFYAVCPTAHLIDEHGRFCSGNCSPGSGACRLDPGYFGVPIPNLKHDYVHRHRGNMAPALAGCSAVVSPTSSARDLMARFFPRASASDSLVIENGRDLQRGELAAVPEPKSAARVLCPGNISQAKGAELIGTLLQVNRDAGSPFEFHFLGRTPPGFSPGLTGAIVHGPYERSDFAQRVARIRPSFALLASICAETYSYALTECWAAGLPVFVADLGALGERVANHGGGWRFPPDSPAAFFAGMLEVLRSPASYQSALQEIRQVEIPGIAEYAGRIAGVYRDSLQRTVEP